MTASTLAMVSGGTSLVLLVLGYYFGIYYTNRFIKTKKKLLPLVAICAFVCGTFYLGPSLSLLSLLINDTNIAGDLYLLLSYTGTPIGGICIISLGFNAFAPKAQKYAAAVFGILAVVFWIFMYGFTATQYDAPAVDPGELLDVSQAGVVRIITLLIMVSILLFDSIGFFIFAWRLKKMDASAKEVQKAIMIGVGWFLFIASGMIDTILPAELMTIWVIVINRGIMILAFLLIFQGYKPPKN
jgi:hypothetical protein